MIKISDLLTVGIVPTEGYLESTFIACCGTVGEGPGKGQEMNNKESCSTHHHEILNEKNARAVTIN